jgi:hypothetical protein
MTVRVRAYVYMITQLCNKSSKWYVITSVKPNTILGHLITHAINLHMMTYPSSTVSIGRDVSRLTFSCEWARLHILFLKSMAVYIILRCVKQILSSLQNKYVFLLNAVSTHPYTYCVYILVIQHPHSMCLKNVDHLYSVNTSGVTLSW